MDTKLSTILHTITRSKAGRKSAFLLFDCSHWLEFMSERHPVVGDSMACPECNLPKRAEADDEKTH